MVDDVNVISRKICVSIVFAALDDTLFEKNVSILPHATLRDAIFESDFLLRYPDFEIETAHFGVYNLRKTLDTGLHDFDRIEIYRPLLIDPKDRRRRVVDEKRDPAKWRRSL